MCSTVQVLCVPGETDFLKEVSDSSAKVVRAWSASPMRGNAGSHVLPTADVDGELFGPGAGANPRLCRDHAATAGGAAAPLAVGANSRLRRDRAAPAVVLQNFFVRGSLLAFDTILLLLLVFVL